ncbi:MAG: hypothetical protein JXA82_18150 [Sedimentisphaerales bacterium]|nr:hypothetical protein [Sedimentisphaerales bacterium]
MASTTTEYQAILDAIDLAITNWVGGPVKFSHGHRTFEYHTLTDLINARKHYVQLTHAAAGSRRIHTGRIIPGGSRG